jgi:kinesin family protein 2/24
MARTAMIATLSPGSGSTDHTVNTLRYADRIKEKRVAVGGGGPSVGVGGGSPPRSLTTMRSTIKGATDVEERQQRATAAIARPPTVPPKIRDNSGDEYDELEEIMNDDDGDGSDDDDIPLGHDDHAPAEDDDRPSNRRSSDIDRTLRRLLEEEENLLNLHMKSIHENAELLTEEGSMLQVVQGEDGDVDAYALRLGEILDRKTTMIRELRERLRSFRNLLMIEEKLSGLQ